MRANRNLDILRALAVLAVLIVHCMPKSPPQEAAGDYAVLIFFVHTALVLLYSLHRMAGSPGLVQRFYVQRAFRIYPLSVACVLVSLAFHISWPETTYIPRSSAEIASNLLLVQNYMPNVPSISAPLWSLPYEVQMYLVLPAIFWYLRRYGMRGAVCLALFSTMLPIVEIAAGSAHWRPMTRYVPCFMGGALAYCGYGARPRFPWWVWPFVVAGAGVAYWALGAMIPDGWLACMLLGAMVPLFAEAPANMMSRAAAVVARYSYGIYLAHAPLLWFCFQRLSTMPRAAQWALFSVSMCIVPVALFHLIESPMIGLGKRLTQGRFQSVEPRLMKVASA
jgi:peptidoglycan/LPS O-acetylase OafA/YrhL